MDGKNKQVLIIGASSAIAQALHAQLSAESWVVHALSREHCDYTEASLMAFAENLPPLELIINCIGLLHHDTLQPEKRLTDISADNLHHYFAVNTVFPALCLKAFVPALTKDGVFITLSAMVGSISDNNLGGWYGYRSSKAALNMLIKTAAIESQRKRTEHCILAVHPGTTHSPLSEPFAKNVPSGRYYSPAQTAARILQVAADRTHKDTGQFYNWDGTIIPW